ncbi:nickel insertion protein [uncultured Desulfovibrio sp.]|uniref:nickel insertion protein n=3 Tax=uncultured Desulfovibrio sp. TaxID=167968 RepID=UPI0025CD6C9F|nr:nickel insertion protein [uncultured Desulfovibrio sp.]
MTQKTPDIAPASGGHHAHGQREEARTRHTQAPPETTAAGPGGRILTIRSHSGLSGDMLLAGLALMNAAADMAQTETAAPPGTAALLPAAERILAELLAPLAAAVPALEGCLALTRREVAGIGGWHADVRLPQAHGHRSLADIHALIEGCGLAEGARRLAMDCFALLARCEAEVHGTRPERVTFHEVGALDSILDICLACALFERLGPTRLVAGALPLADGSVRCAHGLIPAPAPAVLALLGGVPVRPFEGGEDAGELVTPTALALLKTLGCEFGPWPAFRVAGTALVFGTRVFPGTANGAVFAVGNA